MSEPTIVFKNLLLLTKAARRRTTHLHPLSDEIKQNLDVSTGLTGPTWKNECSISTSLVRF
jgi:hypothetical protein